MSLRDSPQGTQQPLTVGLKLGILKRNDKCKIDRSKLDPQNITKKKNNHNFTWKKITQSEEERSAII